MEIKLIDGEFDAAEAREILIKLIDFKINFHEAKIFSAQERNTNPGLHSMIRIEELKRAKKELIDIFNEMGSVELIKIRSKVELLMESKITA
jgi:hypothetical protein